MAERDNSPSFEDDPRYPAAMLKIAFELRNQNGPQFDEIVTGIIDGLDIPSDDFKAYLERYRDDLRQNCKKRGYI